MNTNETNCKPTKAKTTYASRLAARKARRNRPVSVLSKRAQARRAGLHADRMTRLYAMDQVESFAASSEAA